METKKVIVTITDGKITHTVYTKEEAQHLLKRYFPEKKEEDNE